MSGLAHTGALRASVATSAAQSGVCARAAAVGPTGGNRAALSPRALPQSCL